MRDEGKEGEKEGRERDREKEGERASMYVIAGFKYIALKWILSQF